MKEYSPQDIANNIKAVARFRGIVVKDMLERCDMGSNSISHLLHGKMISADRLAQIADYLDCSIDYLMGRTDLLYMVFIKKKSARED